MEIKQGDAYDITITLTDEGGEAITTDAAETVEIALGNIIKTYPGEVTYSDGWLFPLSQEETFAMRGIVPLEVRVKFPTGDVIGTTIGGVSFTSSVSKEVL